jgi:hypothetical protein
MYYFICFFCQDSGELRKDVTSSNVFLSNTFWFLASARTSHHVHKECSLIPCFFNVISVTEKQHRPADTSFSIFNYDYVIEGNGKVRVFNKYNPENDYKDLEFTFKFPSRRLVPMNL